MSRSGPDPVSEPGDLVLVGRLGGAFGVEGWVRVLPESAPEDSVLLATFDWWLGDKPGLRARTAARSDPGAELQTKLRDSPAAKRRSESRVVQVDRADQSDRFDGAGATDAPGEVRFHGERESHRRPFPVSDCRVHGDALVARPYAKLDREELQALKGRPILVSRSAFPAPNEGEFYWVDLIGCDAFDADGALLGQVVRVDDHGAHAILEVLSDSGARHLIPFVTAYVVDVDLARRCIRTEWRREYSQ